MPRVKMIYVHEAGCGEWSCENEQVIVDHSEWEDITDDELDTLGRYVRSGKMPCPRGSRAVIIQDHESVVLTVKDALAWMKKEELAVQVAAAKRKKLREEAAAKKAAGKRERLEAELKKLQQELGIDKGTV